MHTYKRPSTNTQGSTQRTQDSYSLTASSVGLPNTLPCNLTHSPLETHSQPSRVHRVLHSGQDLTYMVERNAHGHSKVTCISVLPLQYAQNLRILNNLATVLTVHTG